MYNEHKRSIATGFHTEAKRAIVDAAKMATTLYELGERHAFIRNAEMVSADAEKYGFELLDLTETEKVAVLDIIENTRQTILSPEVDKSKVEQALQRLGYILIMERDTQGCFTIVGLRPNIEILDNIRKYDKILNVECHESFENMINGWRFNSLICKV